MTLSRAVGAGLLVGVLGWLVLWFQTEPRANFDSLIYHTHALEYAGLSRADADARSWEIYARYADDRERTIIQDTMGDVPWSTPISDRWMGLYQMRPLYPALVAAGYPIGGFRAPMAVSALVTIGYVVLTFVGMGLLVGYRAAAVATVAALLQTNFTHWLVFLTTDGLAMLLWAASITAIALYVKTGRWGWLGAVLLAVLALALTRPTGSLAPIIPVICAVAALIARQPVWRRFAAAAVAASVPAGAVVVGQAVLGFPGIADVFQEIPTRHFALPDIADPIGYTIALNRWAIPDRLLPTLFSQPLLLASIVAGLAGLVIRGSWTSAPFLVAAVVVPVAWIIHPVWFDAGRILAPAWVSLNVGIGLLVDAGLSSQRERIMAFTEWATRPQPHPSIDR
ncbi:MAG: hypothetical protein ACRDFZ_00585 [Candidatus Limnocylindria bacterium]